MFYTHSIPSIGSPLPSSTAKLRSFANLIGDPPDLTAATSVAGWVNDPLSLMMILWEIWWFYGLILC